MSDVVITVRGEHEARVAPEEGVVRLSVRAEGPERGGVVERISALAEPLRTDLGTRKQQGGVREWSSQRVAVWANRPWSSDGKQLALVHYASVEFSAVFTDFAGLSWWITEVAERDGVQVDGIDWQLTRATAKQAEADVAAEAVRVAVDRATAYARAIGLGAVSPLEIADVGLLSRDEPMPAPMPRMMKASFAADAGGGPGVELQPEDIIVSAAVEARFSAR
ncbi:SIMPL domain-containing protein [Microbacterium sp. B2969]|uniref:SIMPL domain-containing protein n=1 Tax=Microbacterium alkaliflavum TaxID=3248839 RepID=A0ABW7Q6E8_9MICO